MANYFYMTIYMAIVKKKNIPVYDEKNCLFSKTKIIPGPFESQANDNDKD